MTTLSDGAFAKYVQGPEFDPYTGRKESERKGKGKRKAMSYVEEKACKSNARYKFYNGQEVLVIL